MAELSKFFVTIGSKFNKAGFIKARAAINKVAIAGIAMGTALVAAGLKAAQIAGIEEKAHINLAQAMKTAGVFSEEAFKHNLEYASSLQKITTYGDEAIVAVQKLLTNYGAQSQSLDDLTKVTLDFATATGMSLEGAAALLGKTIGSSTNALARYGIEVEGAIGSTGRMQSAVEGISRLFGGAAAAEANSYAGKIKQLGNRWSDIVEKIGLAVIPVILKLSEAINIHLFPALEKWAENTENVNEVTNRLFFTMKWLSKIFLGVIGTLDIVGRTIFAIGNEIADSFQSIIVIAEAAFFALTGQFAKAKETLKDYNEGLKKTRKLWGGIGNAFLSWGNAINVVDKMYEDSVKKTLEGAEKIETAQRGLANATVELDNEKTETLSDNADKIEDKYEEIIDTIMARMAIPITAPTTAYAEAPAEEPAFKLGQRHATPISMMPTSLSTGTPVNINIQALDPEALSASQREKIGRMVKEVIAEQEGR